MTKAFEEYMAEFNTCLNIAVQGSNQVEQCDFSGGLNLTGRASATKLNTIRPTIAFFEMERPAAGPSMEMQKYPTRVATQARLKKFVRFEATKTYTAALGQAVGSDTDSSFAYPNDGQIKLSPKYIHKTKGTINPIRGKYESKIRQLDELESVFKKNPQILVLHISELTTYGNVIRIYIHAGLLVRHIRHHIIYNCCNLYSFKPIFNALKKSRKENITDNDVNIKNLKYSDIKPEDVSNYSGDHKDTVEKMKRTKLMQSNVRVVEFNKVVKDTRVQQTKIYENETCQMNVIRPPIAFNAKHSDIGKASTIPDEYKHIHGGHGVSDWTDILKEYVRFEHSTRNSLKQLSKCDAFKFPSDFKKYLRAANRHYSASLAIADPVVDLDGLAKDGNFVTAFSKLKSIPLIIKVGGHIYTHIDTLDDDNILHIYNKFFENSNVLGYRISDQLPKGNDNLTKPLKSYECDEMCDDNDKITCFKGNTVQKCEINQEAWLIDAGRNVGSYEKTPRGGTSMTDAENSQWFEGATDIVRNTRPSSPSTALISRPPTRTSTALIPRPRTRTPSSSSTTLALRPDQRNLPSSSTNLVTQFNTPDLRKFLANVMNKPQITLQKPNQLQKYSPPPQTLYTDMHHLLTRGEIRVQPQTINYLNQGEDVVFGNALALQNQFSQNIPDINPIIYLILILASQSTHPGWEDLNHDLSNMPAHPKTAEHSVKMLSKIIDRADCVKNLSERCPIIPREVCPISPKSQVFQQACNSKGKTEQQHAKIKAGVVVGWKEGKMEIQKFGLVTGVSGDDVTIRKESDFGVFKRDVETKKIKELTHSKMRSRMCAAKCTIPSEDLPKDDNKRIENGFCTEPYEQGVKGVRELKQSSCEN